MSMRSGHISQPNKDAFLQRAIPTNAKYANVTSTIDSGNTVEKFYSTKPEYLLNSRTAYKTMITQFKRIRMATLGRWVFNAKLVESLPDFIETGESIYSLASDEPDDLLFRQGNHQPRCGSAACTLRSQRVQRLQNALSVAGESEASVCTEETGVPPMFAYGPDFGKELVPSLQTSARDKSAYEPDHIYKTKQMNSSIAYEICDSLDDEKKRKTKENSDASNEDDSNSGTDDLTTRKKHEKLIQRAEQLKEIVNVEVPHSGGGLSSQASRTTHISSSTYNRSIIKQNLQPGRSVPHYSQYSNATNSADGDGVGSQKNVLAGATSNRGGSISGTGQKPVRLTQSALAMHNKSYDAHTQSSRNSIASRQSSITEEKEVRRQSRPTLCLPSPTKQFVLLDMREDEDAYKMEHIWGSVFLPFSRLRRSTNKLPAMLHYFVKKEESLVVIAGITGSDLDEVCRLFVEYGLTARNIVVFIQPISEFTSEFPELMAGLKHDQNMALSSTRVTVEADPRDSQKINGEKTEPENTFTKPLNINIGVNRRTQAITPTKSGTQTISYRVNY